MIRLIKISLCCCIMGMTVMLFPSCDGIMSGIYDLPDYQEQYGFISEEEDLSRGVVFINATSYTDWVYIDFKNKETITIAIKENAELPRSWDIAVHRYDAKSNNGEVAETELTDIQDVVKPEMLPLDGYQKDIMTDDKIAVDMSGMMSGNIVYAEDFYNEILSKWLNVDKSTMPPSYTLSGKVYVLKCSDGRLIGLRLKNYVNAKGEKGYMTIEYQII